MDKERGGGGLNSDDIRSRFSCLSGPTLSLSQLRAAIGARTRYKTPIRNFTSDWEDGTAICKLTNAFIQNPDDSIDRS